MKYEDIELIDNKDEHSFELRVEDKKSFIDYKKGGNRVYLLHTEVPPELEGRGIAKALVEKTFRHLEENNLKAVPLCSYVQHFLRRNPEWNRIVYLREK